jgi:hypothetical protein
LRRFAWIAVFVVLLPACWDAAASATTLRPIGSFEHPIFVTSDPANPERKAPWLK